MKRLVKVVRFSSRVAFKKLRNEGPIMCNALKQSFRISNLFFRHISGSSKKRSLFETIKRLSLINLIAIIAEKGSLVEKRENILIEKKRYLESYKVKANIHGIIANGL